MAIEIEINGSLEEDARYVSYAASPCRIRQTDATGPATADLASETRQPGGGAVVFYPAPGADSEETLTLDLPAAGGWVDFWIGGKWQHPSTADKDCQVTVSIAGRVEATAPLMVRVRKNANGLWPAERDRFLKAFARLNNRGQGKYETFRDMHVSPANSQEHGGPHFLPWHRSYLLDLERELQAIDPSVSLHYWRWDEPAPNVFQRSFMGVTGDGGMVEFTAGHPLANWVTDNNIGIRRTPQFDTATSRASFVWQGTRLTPQSQAETLALGEVYFDPAPPQTRDPVFADMEGNPHGWAHVSFDGWISSIPTAAKDPLFFMLHSNVDRLWALWQWTLGRTDPDDPDTYTGQDMDGRRLGDTLWPWNGVTDPPRPDFAPGGTMAPSPAAAAPGPEPALRSMIDFQGWTSSPDRLGYGYDTVPFERG